MALHLGDIAPDFTQESSEGTIHFHEWLGDSWGFFIPIQRTSPRCARQSWA